MSVGIPTTIGNRYKKIGEYHGIANQALLIKKHPGVVFPATQVYAAAGNDERNRVAVVKTYFISKIMKTVEEYFSRYGVVNNDYKANNFLCTETNAGIHECTIVDWDDGSPLDESVTCNADNRSPALRAMIGMQVCDEFLYSLGIQMTDDAKRKEYFIRIPTNE
ncbi:hypothetical protein C8R43DRAFT_1141677 [Mycena crocata]|nr:hypothetical protein C8R43DRAFT_1141677 [Mycena crocata]